MERLLYTAYCCSEQDAESGYSLLFITSRVWLTSALINTRVIGEE
jgi:hypothetical protein